MTREADLSGRDRIFAYVLDGNGDNTIEIGIRDMSDKVQKVWRTEKTKKGEWARVAIDLAQYKDKIDLKRVKNIEIYVWNAGSYVFDDVGVTGGDRAPIGGGAAAPIAAVTAAATDQPSGPSIILQDFEDGNGTSDHDVYVWDYGKAAAKLDAGHAFRGAKAMMTQGDIAGANLMRRSYDLSGYRRVFVNVLDGAGDNTIEIGIRDMNDKVQKVWSTDKSRKGQWTKVGVDLASYRGKIDLTKVKNIEIHEWNKGTYFFDDIGAEK